MASWNEALPLFLTGETEALPALALDKGSGQDLAFQSEALPPLNPPRPGHCAKTKRFLRAGTDGSASFFLSLSRPKRFVVLYPLETSAPLFGNREICLSRPKRSPLWLSKMKNERNLTMAV